MSVYVEPSVANVYPFNNAVSGSHGGVTNDPSNIILYDTFTDTSGTLITAHTPDIGSAATAFVGTEPQIQSGAMTAMAAGTNQALWDTGLTSKEMVIHSSVNAFQVWLFTRYVDSLNLYFVRRSVSGDIRLVEVNAGVFTARDIDTVAYVAGETINVIDDGNTITAILTSNGVNTVLSYATTLFNTETQISVNLTDATTSIDYISVRAL